MLYSSAFLAIAAMTGLVAGQISIDPNSVPADERAGWCNAERNTCPLICDQNVANNTCDPTGLTYNCTCGGTGAQPNISNYQQTLPYFICQTYVANCVAANTNSAQAQANCRLTVCGNETADAESASTTTSSSSMAASTSSMSATGSSASAASTTSSKSSAATLVAVAHEYGTAALAVGLFAAFGVGI